MQQLQSARVTSVLARLRAGRGLLVTLALVTGAGAGLGAVGFRELILGITHLASGVDDHSAVGRRPNHLLPFLGPWFVLVVPVVAGLLYGPLVYRFAPEARGHGVPEVMYAVGRRGGRIPWQVALVKSLASALCIGAGGSVGREGPIVQIGSALGSTAGRFARLPASGLRLLVACGAAGGIAATFNTPIAGVFFALELILRDFAADSFGLVVLSAVLASVIGRSILGDAPFLHLPSFTVGHPQEYVLYAVLGLLGAGAGVAFTRVLYATEDVCDAAWARTRLPEWARPGVGGVLLGLLLLAVPEMYGVGYPVLGAAVAGRYAVPFLLLLLVAKVVATSLTIGIGGSGGVFAPSLFCGAALGAAYGQLLHSAIPGTVGSPGSFSLVGMAAVFAGAARAPITAVLILFELTGEYTIILPLMLTVVVATAASRALSADTVYSLKLRRRGVDLGERPRDDRLDRLVGSVAGPVPRPLDVGLPVAQAMHALARAGGSLPVCADGSYLGVLTALAVHDGGDEAGTLADLVSVPATLRADDPLEHALALMSSPDALGGLPVLDGRGQPVGWLDAGGLLRGLAGPGPA